MSIVGFVVSTLTACIIFLFRKKISIVHIAICVLCVVVSAPLFLTVLFLLEQIDFFPPKLIVIKTYVSFLAILVFTIMTYFSMRFWAELFKRITNLYVGGDSLIQKPSNNNETLSSMINTILLLGLGIGLYGLWIA